MSGIGTTVSFFQDKDEGLREKKIREFIESLRPLVNSIGERDFQEVVYELYKKIDRFTDCEAERAVIKEYLLWGMLWERRGQIQGDDEKSDPEP
ncbi:MAG: hypothetical protein PHQ47_01910 [Candidatus Portnoybacteria bacterium]|nr:hypothetical protein [Candidatus Portnoybacteria bacterium]